MSRVEQKQTDRTQRIETLLQQIAELADPNAQAISEELVRALLDLYGEGLARLMEMIAQAEVSGKALIEILASDELLGSLFLLHGLHPLDIRERITRALEKVRPSLKSRGGNAELSRFEEGVAYVRFQGHGCSSSTAALKHTLEESLYAAVPDLERLEIETVSQRPVPVTFLGRSRYIEDKRPQASSQGT